MAGLQRVSGVKCVNCVRRETNGRDVLIYERRKGHVSRYKANDANVRRDRDQQIIQL